MLIFFLMTPVDTRPLLALCTPGYEFSWMFLNSYAMFLPRLLEQYQCCIECATSNNIYVVRNRCVSDVLTATAGRKLDYVMFIDHDHIYDYDQFILLKKALDEHPELAGIGAWYYVQSGTAAGAEVAAGWLVDDRHITTAEIAAATGPIEVDYCGLGFMLMRGSAIQFEKDPFNPVMHDGSFHGDDVSFMVRAREHGLRFAIHPGVTVPHLKLLGVSPATSVGPGEPRD